MTERAVLSLEVEEDGTEAAIGALICARHPVGCLNADRSCCEVVLVDEAAEAVVSADLELVFGWCRH